MPNPIFLNHQEKQVNAKNSGTTTNNGGMRMPDVEYADASPEAHAMVSEMLQKEYPRSEVEFEVHPLRIVHRFDTTYRVYAEAREHGKTVKFFKDFDIGGDKKAEEVIAPPKPKKEKTDGLNEMLLKHLETFGMVVTVTNKNRQIIASKNKGARFFAEWQKENWYLVGILNVKPEDYQGRVDDLEEMSRDRIYVKEENMTSVKMGRLLSHMKGILSGS
jgi:hypothetical protein